MNYRPPVGSLVLLKLIGLNSTYSRELCFERGVGIVLEHSKQQGVVLVHWFNNSRTNSRYSGRDLEWIA